MKNEELKVETREEGVWPPPPLLRTPLPTPREPIGKMAWIILLMSIGFGLVSGGLWFLQRHSSHLKISWMELFIHGLIETVGVFGASMLYVRWLRQRSRDDAGLER
jgi:hypothetical protein